MDELIISAFAGSNVTMLYTEIGASFQQQPFWSIVVGGGFFLLFDYSSLVVLKYCAQMIIDFHQLSHYYNILRTKLLTKLKITFILLTYENDILCGCHSPQQYNKLYVKGDQAYTCNLQPWVSIIPGLYLIMRIALYRHIYNMTYFTCTMYKYIYYFMTCEISDVTMSTTCMAVIYTNYIICMVFN